MGWLLPAAPGGLILPAKPLRVPQTQLAVSNGLVGYWPLSYDSINEVTNKVESILSGSFALDIVSIGTADLRDTATGGGIAFNGSNQNALTNTPALAPAELSKPFSLTCWVNGSSFSGTQIFLAVGSVAGGSASYLSFRADQSSRFAFTADGSGSFANSSSSGTPSTGRFYFLAGVAYANAAGGIVLFVNGLPESTTAAAWGGGGAGSDSTAIASAISGGAKAAATIYECRIYNRALDAGEVMELYQTGLAGRRDRLSGFTGWELPALPPGAGIPSGTLAATEAPDTAAFNGTAGVAGTLASTETPDVASFSGTVAVTGTLATTESPDTAAFNGNTVVSGTWVSTEAADTAALSGNTVASGSFAVTEAQDVASFAGSGIVSGTFAATDTPDIAVLSGNAGTSGSLSATTSQDVAVFAGNFGIAGTLVSTEASDLAVFVGQFGIASGTLAANDNTDIAAFIGSATGAPSGSLAVTDLPDNVVFLIDYMAPPSVTAASPYPSPFDYGWSYGEPPLRPGMPGSGTGRSS